MFIKRAIIIFLAVYFAVLLIWWIKLPSKPSLIVIPQGSSASQIASIIYNAGVITSPKIFLCAVKISGNAEKLKAGTYMISPRKTLLNVINVLSKGQSQSIKITIPEGYTSRQIAEVLLQYGLDNDIKFLDIVNKNKLEGYLFPDTYFIDQNTDEEKFIERMVGEFNRNFTQEMKQKAKDLKMNERKIVILASLIEKEAAYSGEMPHISAVFHNRLKKYWRLESDPTVLYAMGKNKSRVTYKDLKFESPYNTYLHSGLPPGPICNPGKNALFAALYPSASDDMFFVMNDSGTHTFSRSYSEHLINVRKRNIK